MNQLTVTPTRIPAVTIAGSPLFALVDYLSSIVTTLEAWRQRDANSTQLAHTDPRTLRDIGISESQQFIEAGLMFVNCVSTTRMVIRYDRNYLLVS